MKLRQFNVTLIESMGKEGMRQAWLTSKPTFKYSSEEELQKDLDMVVSNDLPLSGFNMYCFKIGSSILFRDLLFTMRPIQAWATSSRIVQIKNLGMESNYPISETALNLYTKTEKLQESGESLDHSKRYAPLQQYTEFCIVIDLRTLMVFAKTIKECDTELYDSHVIPMLDLVGIKISDTKSKGIYDKLCISDKTMKEIDLNEGLYYAELTDSYELGVRASFALGAQFLRQHFARVRCSIWNSLKEIGYREMLSYYSSSDKFYYLSTAEISQWNQVCSRRTCFVAQFDWQDEFGWDYIIGNWVNKLNYKEFASNLPCKGCGKNCNIFNETSLRLFTNRKDRESFTNNPPDENPPCPLLIEDPSMICKREEMYKSNSNIFNKWKELCAHLTNNPHNAARLFYEGKSDLLPKDTSYFNL